MSEELNKKLIDAIYDGDLDTVMEMVQNGIDIHYNDDLALQWASSNGHIQVVKYLVSEGADIHADYDSALHLASRYGHITVATYLKNVMLFEKLQKAERSQTVHNG